MAFLDNNGLTHLWSKIVNLFNKRIEVSETAPTEEENKIWLQPITTNAGAVDYIVEEGVSDIWTYRKWNSGIAECWGSYNLTIPITTEYGGNHYYGVILERDFPTGLFLETPHTMLSITDDSGNVFALKRHSSRTTTGAMYALSLVSMANDTVYVDIEAKGKWK